jgi:hypothetical protein
VTRRRYRAEQEVPAARDQSHPIAVTLDAEAETVVLDFVEPLWAGTLVALVGRQNSNDLGMPHNQAHSADFANPA